MVGKPFVLDAPFFVLATQNPVEQEGTYPLPEAQLDRFMFLIELDYPVGGRGNPDRPHHDRRCICPSSTICCTPSEIIAHQNLVRRVPVPDHIYAYAARLVRKTRPNGGTAPAWLKPLVAWGAGPRAVQNLILGAKARAALLGSYMVRLEDVQEVAAPVLTHRLITTFAAQAEGISCEGDRAPAGRGDRRSESSRLNRTLHLMPTCCNGCSPTAETRSFLEPAVLSRLAAAAASRRPMQGNVSGRHASPHRGSSVEFAEYRKYVPGDDLRRLDWRALRPVATGSYIKEFEADTNLRCCLVARHQRLDGFRLEGVTKIEYARRSPGPSVTWRFSKGTRSGWRASPRAWLHDSAAAQPGASCGRSSICWSKPGRRGRRSSCRSSTSWPKRFASGR